MADTINKMKATLLGKDTSSKTKRNLRTRLTIEAAENGYILEKQVSWDDDNGWHDDTEKYTAGTKDELAGKIAELIDSID